MIEMEEAVDTSTIVAHSQYSARGDCYHYRRYH